MEHVGIDVGSRYSQICVRTGNGEIVYEKKVRTTDLPAWFFQQKPSRVVMETCAEAFLLADHASEAKHDPIVVPSTLSRQLGVGQRRLKNDTRDGRALSAASTRVENLPRVHVPTRASREMKELCGNRDTAVRMRTKLVNRVRGTLRSLLMHVKCTPETLPAKVRDALQAHPTKLMMLEPLLATLEALNVQIRELDKLVKETAKKHPVCRQLMTIPGVGPITSLRFVAAIDDPRRFKDGTKVASYVGLTPGEDTTGYKRKTTRITKAGDSQLRWTLVQAAWCLWRRRQGDRQVRWAKKLAERSSTQSAVVALARKLCVMMHAMWKNGSAYDPQRDAQTQDMEEEDVRAQLTEALRD